MTRVWFENDAIQMDGVGSLPARSLRAVIDGDRVHVLTLSDVRLSQLLYGEYARKDGSGFASSAAAKAYLDSEFAKAPIFDWSGISGKPNFYPPSAHTHLWGEITDKPVVFPPVAHTHAWGEITGRPTTFPPAVHTHLWADITDKPTTFPPAAHSHAGLLTYLGDITVTETLLISLAVGMKRKTFPLAGVATSDKLTLVATGAPTAGCEAVNVYPASAGNVSIGYYTPLLGIGATYSIPVSVYRVTP